MIADECNAPVSTTKTLKCLSPEVHDGKMYQSMRMMLVS
jgi:hypothetical protein